MRLFGPERSALDEGLDAFAAKSWKKARRYLEDAALAEHPRALGDYHLGLLYWRGLGGPRDIDGAVKYFRRAAESGHAAAQTALGIALSTGAAGARDDLQARELFRAAAGAGDPDAMTELAALSAGHEAGELLQRAAESGHPRAMQRYADFLMETDPVESLAWLYASVSLTGDHDTAKHAEALAHQMSAREIETAQKRGRALLKRLRQESQRR